MFFELNFGINANVLLEFFNPCSKILAHVRYIKIDTELLRQVFQFIFNNIKRMNTQFFKRLYGDFRRHQRVAVAVSANPVSE